MPSSIKHLKQLFKIDNIPIVLFSKWAPDNLYYIVKLSKLDEKKGRCLIKYEDGLECWVDKRDLHLQFSGNSLPLGEDIFCCLCEGDESESNNEVILCDTCQQGFHQLCHEPNIRQVDIENDSQGWTCQTCAYILSQLDPISKTSTPRLKPRAKKNSPRSIALKALHSNRQAPIKLTREKKNNKPSSQESSNDKKASQQSSKNKKVAPESSKGKKASQESIKGVKASQEPTKDELTAEKPIQEDETTLKEPVANQWTPVNGEPSPDKEADKEDVVEPENEMILNSDFVQEVIGPARTKAKPSNGKRGKKAVAKKSSKIPAPA